MSILKEISQKIEQISIDEAFMDVSDSAQKIASLTKSIQTTIQEQCRLPCSFGVATNKLVAKIATDVGKGSIITSTYPNAIMIIPPGDERNFLAPLPLESLWGVGPKTADNLRQLGIKNIGELAGWPVQELVKRFGKIGYDLHERANGIDNRPIETFREPKSYSQEITFSRDTISENMLNEQIKKQSERISKSLVEANLICNTIKLKIRWPNFSTISRQITLLQPTNDAKIILETAKKLFLSNWDRKTPIRLIGVGVSGLNPPSKQLSLWDKVDYTKLAQLEAIIYQVKSKYGEKSIQKGVNSSKQNRERKNNYE